MKRTLLLFICFLVFLSTHAQNNGNSISGTVLDSTSGKGLEYATITVYAAGNTKALTGTVTDKSGNFSIKDLADGKYEVTVEFIGYRPLSLPEIILSKTKFSIDLKKVFLTPVKSSMQGVTVVAQAKLIENKIDKMVFNVEKDITSQSGVASDALKKIPQVSVDIDGNVQLAGSGGVRFLINGKPSTAFGASVADVLQSIPASQIKSIEVITNPGAKYDAQGLGGIINIILKTSNAKGYNGNLSLTAGTRQENGNFNFNARNNNFGINAFVGGNKRLKSTTISSFERRANNGSTSSSLLQNGEGHFTRYGMQTGVGFDWTIKKYNNLSGSVSYNSFGNKGGGRSYQDFLSDINNGSTRLQSLIIGENNSKFKNTDANLTYKRTFAKEDRELEISVNSSFGNNRTMQFNTQSQLPKDSIFYGTNNTNPATEKETEISADYTEPINDNVVLGLGGKTSFYNINSNSSVFSYRPVPQTYLYDTSLNNALDYKQKVYAVYAELSFPVGALFDAKVGGRYERTEINSYYSNAQQQAKVPGYNTFVPSVFLSKKITDDQTIKLSYSKRIERPDYEDLNPYVNVSDPKNLSAGNPNLKPETGHRMELGYNRDFGKVGSMMINLFYRINEQDIQPYIVFYPSYKAGDSTYTNVSVSMRQNIGMERNFGMNIFGDVHISSKLSIRGNVFFFRRHTINTIDKGFNTNSFNYRTNLNSTYQFTSTLAAEFFGNFSSPRNEAQGKYPSMTTYSLAVRKQFWKKKGSLALNANNFLKEYLNQPTELFGPSFTTNSNRKIPFRSIGLNFTWKFGKLEFKKSKQEEPGVNPSGE